MTSSYLKCVFNERSYAPLVNRAIRKIDQLRKAGIQVDTLAFRGTSGAALAYPLSYLTGLKLIFIRKNESTHGDKIEASRWPYGNYLIVDDLISTGTTVRTIYRAVQSHCASRDPKAKCVGVLLYNDTITERFVSLDQNKIKLPVFTIRSSAVQ